VDNNEVTDSTVDLPDINTVAPKELIDLAENMVQQQLEEGKDLQQALDYISGVAMPLDNAGFRISLENRFMGGK